MSVQDFDAKLTAIEAEALQAVWNLSDAHTHQAPDHREQVNIIDQLPQIYSQASRIKQSVADTQVFDAYHRLAGQRTADASRSMLCYSSSQALEIVANFLRMTELNRIALLEPTFDNIPDILMRQGCQLLPVRLQRDWIGKLERVISLRKIRGIMLVNPNNPTGDLIDRETISRLSKAVACQNIVLVIDASFRLFDSRCCYDLYKVLNDARASYIVVEDTGKIWPTLDIKLAFINCSIDIEDRIRQVHQDFLLNVSPFVCLLVEKFCQSSMDDDLASVRQLIADNRQRLRATICDSGLALTSNLDSRVSVEFLQLHPGLSSGKVARYLGARHGVWTLPGSKFFWAGSANSHDSYLRVALSRDRDYFRMAVSALAAGLESANRLEL